MCDLWAFVLVISGVFVVSHSLGLFLCLLCICSICTNSASTFLFLTVWLLYRFVGALAIRMSIWSTVPYRILYPCIIYIMHGFTFWKIFSSPVWQYQRTCILDNIHYIIHTTHVFILIVYYFFFFLWRFSNKPKHRMNLNRREKESQQKITRMREEDSVCVCMCEQASKR